MEARDYLSGGRRQLTPILTRTAELGGDECGTESRLSPLNAAPDMAVAPADLRGRMLDRAGSMHSFEDGDEPGTEPKTVRALHPDLDPGTEDGAARLGFRSGTRGDLHVHAPAQSGTRGRPRTTRRPLPKTLMSGGVTRPPASRAGDPPGRFLS